MATLQPRPSHLSAACLDSASSINSYASSTMSGNSNQIKDQEKSATKQNKQGKKSKGDPMAKKASEERKASQGEERATRVKRPKGPKPAKPKPKAFQFYHQELANDMATKLFKVNDTTIPTTHAETESSTSTRQSLESLQGVFKTTRTTTTTTTTTTTRTQTSTVYQKRGFLQPVTIDVPESSRASSMSDLTQASSQKPARREPSRTRDYRVVTLDDKQAMQDIEALLLRYGGVNHGGILDHSYSFFITRACDAALSFIVKDKVAVLGGDPLCEPSQFGAVLQEFKEYRKKMGLGIAIMGGSDVILDYAKANKWTSIRFGTERVLNPMNNPVLQEKAQKQIIRQNKQLLDPAKYGLSLGIYSPSYGEDLQLQEQLTNVYESWRNARNTSGVPQAYTTVYDPFCMPNLMIYIFTRDREGTPNGFAALRKMGVNRYYIDPCIAAPGAPRRIPDLLYFTAMSLLNQVECSFLSIGMEPSVELEIHGFPGPLEKLAKHIHGKMFNGLKLGGKKEYHDKFRPDEDQNSGLYLMFPSGMPSLRQLTAVIHFCNISIRRLIKTRLDYKGTKEDSKDSKEEEGKSEKEDGEATTEA